MPMQKELVMLNKKVAKKIEIVNLVNVQYCETVTIIELQCTSAPQEVSSMPGGARVCLEVWPGVFSIFQQFKNKSAAISGLCCVSWWLTPC